VTGWVWVWTHGATLTVSCLVYPRNLYPNTVAGLTALSSLLCIVLFIFTIYTDRVMGLVGKRGFMWSWFIKFLIWFSVGLDLYVSFLLLLIIIIFFWADVVWVSQANYYIAFVILSEALEDPAFNLHGINIVNVILNYFYVGLLLMCFILSLGNRPQGSKWGYTLAMIGFALITMYMTVCVFVCFGFCFISFFIFLLSFFFFFWRSSFIFIGFSVFTCY
jgi:hypothetical protein